MENSSNRNVKFQAPIFPKQSLANGFLLGKLNFDNNIVTSISLGSDRYPIPATIAPQVLTKASPKSLDLSGNCFCGVYPRTLVDGTLTVEISTIFYQHEFNADLVDRFRIRGEIISYSGDCLEIKVTTTKNVSNILLLSTDDKYDGLEHGRFYEVYAIRVENRLVVSDFTPIE